MVDDGQVGAREERRDAGERSMVATPPEEAWNRSPRSVSPTNAMVTVMACVAVGGGRRRCRADYFAAAAVFLRADFRGGWLRQHVERVFMHSACSGSVSGGVFCRQMIW